MNSSKLIGVILILAGLVVGYIGFTKVSDNTKSVEVIGIEIEASNESGKQEGYLLLGLAAALLIGGVYTVNRAKG